MNALWNWWNGLQERERMMLGTGALVCLVWLFYLLVYAPVTRTIHDKSEQLVQKQKTLAWMQSVRHQNKPATTEEVVNNGALLTILANQLTTTAFVQFTYQLQQTGTGDIQLSFAQVPYNAFMRWLSAIHQKYAITIKQLIIDRIDNAPGVVKISVIISVK